MAHAIASLPISPVIAFGSTFASPELSHLRTNDVHGRDDQKQLLVEINRQVASEFPTEHAAEAIADIERLWPLMTILAQSQFRAKGKGIACPFMAKSGQRD